jgi:hypothetical protein
MLPRWLLPGVVALVFLAGMIVAKDSMPWPVFLGAALAFLAAAGWTLFIHNQDWTARRR